MGGYYNGVSDDGTLDPERLIEARTAKGLNQSELARLIGVKPQAIQAMEAGRVKRTRYLQELATALDRPAGWFVGENNQRLQEGAFVKYAKYRGIAAGGLWQEDSRQAADDVRIPAAPDKKYAGAPQIAYRVLGNSMNKVVRDGEYVICVDYQERPIPLRDGDLVVAERRRGGEIQRTVKRVRSGPGRTVELWPESDDPKHQKPLVLHSKEPDAEVTVVGLVIGYYRPV
jgi:transcriptional regulator with XRE-family HTH domain